MIGGGGVWYQFMNAVELALNTGKVGRLATWHCKLKMENSQITCREVCEFVDPDNTDFMEIMEDLYNGKFGDQRNFEGWKKISINLIIFL